ncbi:MAG TPA: hypothetical protein VG318_14335, partial [Actinomycetota bacterium]|nr:hypothetical protein [Actinomycetota bacterium]
MLLALVAADTAAGAQDDPCTTVADDDALHAAGRPTAQGHFPHEEWAVDPGSQRAFGHVHSLMQSTFGLDSKEDPDVTLRQGLIGSVLDHRQRQMVVVVDPDKVDVSALQPRAEAAAAKAGKGRTNGRPFALVVAGCAEVQDLLSASSVIAERSWHPDA